jgi:hypothetical protein
VEFLLFGGLIRVEIRGGIKEVLSGNFGEVCWKINALRNPTTKLIVCV